MTTSSKMISLAAAMVLIAAVIVEAQPSSDCAAKLTRCSQFLNSTNPPKTCCDPLKDAITNDRQCLCNLYSSGVLSSFGINVTEALLLPKNCGISNAGDLSACGKTSDTSPTTTPSSVPPAAPSGENGAGRESWTWILSVLLLIYASVLVF